MSTYTTNKETNMNTTATINCKASYDTSEQYRGVVKQYAGAQGLHFVATAFASGTGRVTLLRTNRKPTKAMRKAVWNACAKWDAENR